jgi:hypothetical protein
MRSNRGAPKGSVLGVENGLVREPAAAGAFAEVLGVAVDGDVAGDVEREQLATAERRRPKTTAEA